MQTKTPPIGLRRTPVWGPALHPMWRHLTVPQKSCCCVVLLLATHLGCISPQSAFPKASPLLPDPLPSQLSLCKAEEAELALQDCWDWNQSSHFHELKWQMWITFLTLVFCYLTSVYVHVAVKLTFNSRWMLFLLHWRRKPLMKVPTWAYFTEPVMACESITHLWKKSVETLKNFAVAAWKEKHTFFALEGWGHQNCSSSSGCNETPQGIILMTWHLEEMLDNCHPQFWNDGWLTNSTASQGDSLVGRMIHMRTISHFLLLLFYGFFLAYQWRW